MRARPAVVLFVLAAAFAPVAAQGTLTIHQINVQQGDCTLIVGPDGIVYEQDFGEDTASIAGAIEEYNPDDSWREVD